MSLNSIITGYLGKGVESSSKYARSTIDYYALSVFYKVSKIATKIVKSMVYSLIGLVAVVYFSVAGTIWLADFTGSSALACLIVGGLFVLLLLLTMAFKKVIERAVVRHLSEDVLNELMD